MKARLIIWGIVLAVIALIVYQNQEFYLSEQSLSLNLFAKIEIPPMANVTHVLIYFLAGLLMACISLYHERYKLRRQIKKLDVAFSSCADQVAQIKSAESTPSVRKLSHLMDKFRKKKGASEPLLPESTDIEPEQK